MSLHITKNLEETKLKKFAVAAVGAGVCAIALTGCYSMPKNRSEFIHHENIQKTVFTVPRNMDAVIAGVNKRADTCINTGYTQSGTISSMSRTIQIMSIKKVSPRKAELDYVQRSNNVVGEPEGGMFMIAADFEANGARSTKVILYHGSFQETLLGAVRKWIEGDVSSCHGYGG